MKNLIILVPGTVAVCALNIGCTASASVKPTSTSKPASHVQMAFVAAPQTR